MGLEVRCSLVAGRRSEDMEGFEVRRVERDLVEMDELVFI